MDLARLERWAPLASGLGVLLVLSVLSWPMPLYLNDWHLFTMFGDSHVWVMDNMVDHLLRGELPTQTFEAGYPQVRDMKAIGWAPLLLTIPLRLVFSPLGAANLVQLLSLPVSAAVATAMFLRFADTRGWVAAAMGAAWALCPTLLSTYGMGEISNTQAWILPGFLLLADLGLERPRWLVALAGFTLLSLLSSPYFGMILPLLAAGLLVYRALRPREELPWRTRGLRVLLLGIALGAAALPARAYFGEHQDKEMAWRSLFRPARHGPETRGVPEPSPVARPGRMLYEGPTRPETNYDPMHSVYLGLAMLGGTLALVARGDARRRRGYAPGLALAAGGVILALGPRLVLDSLYVVVNDRYVYLPVSWLESIGYPTRDGGMYFRYTAVATLGLSLAAAAGLGALPRGPLIAALLAAVQIVDSARATGPLWPRPGEPVPGRALMASLQGSDGAVLELPIQGPMDMRNGQDALLRAVFHGRPATSMPRDVLPVETVLPYLLTQALESMRPTQVLREDGFRYVILPVALEDRLSEGESALIQRLGEPGGDALFKVWDLGSTTPRPITGS